MMFKKKDLRLLDELLTPWFYVDCHPTVKSEGQPEEGQQKKNTDTLVQSNFFANSQQGALATTTAKATSTSKRQQFYQVKQQPCACSTLFLYISLSSLQTTLWKCLISRFMEDVNKLRQFFLSLSKLECGRQEIKSREIRPHLTFQANWNIPGKVRKKENSFLK